MKFQYFKFKSFLIISKRKVFRNFAINATANHNFNKIVFLMAYFMLILYTTVMLFLENILYIFINMNQNKNIDSTEDLTLTI